MKRKTNVPAWFALVFGVLCLIAVAVWAGFIFPNAAVREYSKFAWYLVISALICVTAGSLLAILAFIFGCIGLKRARQEQTPSRRDAVFSVVGIAGGALLAVINILFFIFE